jgi:hypothetical protein
MPMDLIFSPTNTIYDQNHKKLLKYPLFTLLDKICVDMWKEIIRYIILPPFILGFNKELYPRYRQLKFNEYDTYKNDFFNYHNQNNGIPNPYNLSIKNSYLTIDKHYLQVNGYSLVCCNNTTTQLIQAAGQNYVPIDSTVKNEKILCSNNYIDCICCAFVCIFVLDI